MPSAVVLGRTASAVDHPHTPAPHISSRSSTLNIQYRSAGRYKLAPSRTRKSRWPLHVELHLPRPSFSAQHRASSDVAGVAVSRGLGIAARGQLSGLLRGMISLGVSLA